MYPGIKLKPCTDCGQVFESNIKANSQHRCPDCQKAILAERSRANANQYHYKKYHDKIIGFAVRMFFKHGDFSRMLSKNQPIVCLDCKGVFYSRSNAVRCPGCRKAHRAQKKYESFVKNKDRRKPKKKEYYYKNRDRIIAKRRLVYRSKADEINTQRKIMYETDEAFREAILRKCEVRKRFYGRIGLISVSPYPYTETAWHHVRQYEPWVIPVHKINHFSIGGSDPAHYQGVCDLEGYDAETIDKLIATAMITRRDEYDKWRRSVLKRAETHPHIQIPKKMMEIIIKV